MKAIKNLLLAKCFEYVEQRIETSKQAMRYAQDSANVEEKSSAGDKYETGRAMAQIERDKAAHQLEEALLLKSMLSQIKPIVTNSKVVQGSLVITETTRFFLAISMGKITLEGKDFLVIAPTSPIGQLLLKLAAGDQFSFNKQIHIIQEIF
ncbi:MAG: 3-oxoacyl-ACP synthase [Bacteroidota bacterium]